MTFSQSGAELRGGQRKRLIARIREIDREYSVAGLGATAAMAEIRAALREMDRGAQKGGK